MHRVDVFGLGGMTYLKPGGDVNTVNNSLTINYRYRLYKVYIHISLQYQISIDRFVV